MELKLKFLEESVGEYLNLEVVKDFFKRIQKALIIKGKHYNVDFIKLKLFIKGHYWGNKPHSGGKYLQNIFDKVLVESITPTKYRNEKMNNSILKMAKILNRHMPNKHMKRCSMSLSGKEQIKGAMGG